MPTISVPGKNPQAWELWEVAPALSGDIQVTMARRSGREQERIVLQFAPDEWRRVTAVQSVPTGKAVFTPGDIIRELRERLSLSQWQLARKLGTNRVTVSQWERGAKQPPPWLAIELLEWLGTAVQAAE
ncbi:MAG: helix-turn-helix transcriptional regulator [Chloroflexi bacterium]|nr:helix-turn-helix transcriptional regulator [Chloroflexota bacterium]